MGLFDYLRQFWSGFFGPPSAATAPEQGSRPAELPAPCTKLPQASEAVAAGMAVQPDSRKPRRTRQRINGGQKLRLQPLRYRTSLVRTPSSREFCTERPYRFATQVYDCLSGRRGFLDLSRDADIRWLNYYGLPLLKQPDELARWLGISLGQLVWLTQLRQPVRRPAQTSDAHYVYSLIPKRSGRKYRLIEAPKPLLKRVQQQILREILDLVPAHPAAHGFTPGRSIITNAQPHLGQRFVLKFDLEDFYPSISFRRVVAIFRSLGFSREIAIWLGRLTTSQIPGDLRGPDGHPAWTSLSERFLLPHLPQGAPTSPALANLSAYSLDVRLAGLAARYHVNYTRYADDLTFSGSGRVLPALPEMIQLVERIIRDERFQTNRAKRRLLRDNQRQVVTGVVVNQKVNVSRAEFDRLKAILHNCLKHGPASQNRQSVPHFADHLRGRIAHIEQLNPDRGQQLLALYQRIRWDT